MPCRIPPVYLRRFLERLRDKPALARMAFEGDSWFSYPGLRGGNLYSRLSRRYAREAASLQMAEPGDVIASIMQGCQHRLLREAFETHRIDLLLYSGGGNDVVGDDLRDLVKPASEPQAGMPARFVGMALPRVVSDHLSLRRFDHALQRIEAGFHTILDLRDRYRPGAVVVGHSYDYARPSGRGFRVGSIARGPWLRPFFDEAGVPRERQQDLVVFLIDQFARALAGIVATRGNFIVVDTRGTLRDDEWADEIHPSAEGFARLVDERWIPLLDALLR
jgi:lysophospholipase L1-like esterase